MRTDLELASFRGNDHPGLVAASLACPVCLSGMAEWSLDPDDQGGEAHCRCRVCGHRHDVALSFEQALRLALQRGRPLPTEGPLVVGEPMG